MPFDEYDDYGVENEDEDGGPDEQFYSAREEGEDSEDVEADDDESGSDEENDGISEEGESVY